MKKRILSMLLAIVMVVGLLPGMSLTAFAAENLTDTTTNVTLTPDANGYYQIGTADELIAFANLVNGGNSSINGILTENITLNEDLLTDKLTITKTEGLSYAKGVVKSGETVESWTPIGTQDVPYAGTFDGNGKKITGLYVNVDARQLALFGTVTGTVKNVTVAEYHVTGRTYLGAVVGWLDGGTVSNCHANGGWIYTTSSGYNGGVVGYATNKAKIEDCTHSGNLLAYDKTGGIVGYADKESVISRCENTGYLYGSGTRVGGIVGDLENPYSTVEYSSNSGTVKSNNTFGGVVGYASQSTVKHCYNTGNMIGRGNYTSNAGGVVGSLYKSSAEYCYNTGNISGEHQSFQIVGGIAGNVSDGTIKFCYNTGSLSANDTIGGIAGSAMYETTISNCYSACTITPTTEEKIGSLVGGFNGRKLLDNYYDSDKSSFAIIGKNFNPTKNTDTNNNGVPTAQFTSGQVCYELNGSTSEGDLIWYQTIGTHDTPVFDGKIVYHDASTNPQYWNERPTTTTTYTVTVTTPTNGIVSGGGTYAAGDTVTLTVIPAENYAIDTITYNDGTSDVEITATEGVYSFTMPANNVTVNATFKRVYKIIIADNIQNGTLTADKYVAAEGELVTLTATPNEGYEKGQYTTTVTGYVSITLSNDAFTMPACDVTVSVKFVDASAYGVRLPANPGYTVKKTADTVTPIPQGSDYSFTVNIWDGYEATENFTVYDWSNNKTVLTPDANGVYTISDVDRDLWIVVNGVLPIKPDASGDFAGTNYPFTIVCANDDSHNLTAPYYADGYVTLGNITGSTGTGCYMDVTYNVKAYFASVYPNHSTDGLPESVVFQTEWNVSNRKWEYERAAVQYDVSCAAVPTTYTVTVAGTTNGAVTATPTTASEGATVTLTVTPATNYELDALTVTDASGNPVTVTNYAFTMPESNVTVTATFKAKTYTITYVLNGGTINGAYATSYAFGDSVSLPQNVTREGYYFAGWYDAAEGGTGAIMGFGRPETGDKTFYARWTPRTYTVTWIDEDGYSPLEKDENVPYGTTPSYDGETPTKAENAQYTYTFAGWTPTVSTVTGNATYKATYTQTPKTYKINYVLNGGTINGAYATSYAFGDSVSLPQNVTREGYYFAGWYDAAEGGTGAIMGFGRPETGDKTFYARWTPKTYTVKFVDHDGAEIDSQTVNYGTAATAPVDPTREGYTFTGWDKDFINVTADLTVKAQYIINQYTITFDTDGGSAVKAIMQDYGTAITAPAAPTKEGHTFKGWDTEIPSTMPADNMTIKAQWTVNKHDIIYMVDGVEYQRVKDVAYGTAITLIDTPTKTGSTFSGWSELPATMPDEDVTITGTFSVNEYTITFDTDGGSAVAPITRDYNTAVEKPADPTKTGFDFGGWYADAELTNAYVFGTMPAENITVYAKWNPATGTAYTVKHYHQNTSDSGYTLYESETLRGTTNAETAAEAKNYPGFTAQAFIQTTVRPDGTAVVEIKYDRNTYTVTLVTNRGTIRDGDVTEYTYGVGAKLPANVTRNGYYFGGWYDNEDCKGTPVTEISTTDIGNKTFYAKWDFIYIPIVTPTYPPVVDGGDNGDVVVTPKNPEKGDTVVITPDPDTGYEVDEIIVTDKNGNPVTVVDNGDGTYSFKQPSGKVTIKVTFKEIITVCPCDWTCPLYGYTDLDMTAWYHDGVHFCIEHGLMQGVGNNQFNPNGTTTRAMIVTILWRLEGSPVVNYLMDFEDVAADQWYTEAIRWAASEKIVEGYGDTFGPNDPITREQMVTIMWRYAKYKGYDVSVGENTNILSYDDAFDVAEWAIPAMQWACGEGLIQGIADGSKMNLAPQGNATRAQAAAILQRFCENVTKED